MEEYKLASKYFNKKKNRQVLTNSKWLYSLINRTLVSVLLLLIALCLTKNSTEIKEFISQNVYNKNINFTKFNKLIGNIYTVVEPVEKDEQVFNEAFTYKNKESYKDGVKLIVSNNYLMPALESGIVVYIGNKDNYGHTIIVQQVNGIDLWYVGINNTNLKLYDYIEKGSLLGEVSSNEIYLYYQKDGKFIDYKEYLG